MLWRSACGFFAGQKLTSTLLFGEEHQGLGGGGPHVSGFLFLHFFPLSYGKLQKFSFIFFYKEFDFYYLIFIYFIFIFYKFFFF
jgi:hypothetical protein